MNRMSRFLIEAVGAMVLVSCGGGFIPTASACYGDSCKSLAVTGSAGKYTINNSDPHLPITVTGCTVSTKNAPSDSESACSSGSKFTKIIAPNGSYSPPVAHDMVPIVLRANVLWDPKRIIYEGCTAEQLNTARGRSCTETPIAIEDVPPGEHHYDRVMRCKGETIECCLKDLGDNSYRQCHAIVVYPKESNPPKVDVVCENLKPEKGVWTADLPFKQKPDKIHCTLAFTCGSPPANKLSADERKCTAVAFGTKSVTKEGNCADKNCTACDVVEHTPNDPCNVSFRKP
jgi:hypothetical protein